MIEPAARLKDLCEGVGQYGLNIAASEYSAVGVRMLRTTDLHANGQLRDDVDPVFISRLPSTRFLLREGDLLLTRSGSVGRSFLVGELSAPTTFAGFLVRFRPRPTADSRFIAYVAESTPFQDAVQADAISSTIQNFNAERYANIEVPNIPLDEQRRIADFLDAEIATMESLIDARARQADLLRSRLRILIDALGVGNFGPFFFQSPESRFVRMGHIADILPGNAFPSDGYSTDSDDTRLLRGINVSVGATDWTESVYWPHPHAPALRRFFLRFGDVVLGMDRPWIAGGMRIAMVSKMDLPALLLQRVARLRPRLQSVISNDYLFWALQSSAFRDQVEVDLTGVSIPHLSGPQIAAYRFPLPDRAVQDRIAGQLWAEQDTATALIGAIERSRDAMRERRAALITAAVSGSVDVTTADGRTP